MEIVWAAETNRFVLRLPLPDLLRSETTLCQSLNDVNSVTSLFEQLQLRSRLQCAVKEPLVISLDGKEMDHPNKKSLFELLVSFEQTQDQMVSLLLDALVDDEEANRRVTLHGLRLIDRVFNVGSVIRNLTSVLAKVSQQTRMDLVKLAFEIVPESQHKSLIADLAVLMTNNRELMASPVLTMSSRVEIEDLNLRSELVDSALKNLSKHAPIETLRFLFSTVPTTKSLELYESLRQHTDTAELTRMRVFDLFIETLSTELTLNKSFREAALKYLVENSERQLGQLDIIVLMIIVNSGDAACRKKVESIFSSLSNSQDFQVELSEIVSNSPQIFSCAFNQLLATAYSSASQLTNVLLPQLFSVARGDEDRKQIIESILDAVTVSTDNSRMAQESLAVLKTISKRMRGELLPFKEMINASLQSNGEMDAEHASRTRELYGIICDLAVSDQGHCSQGTVDSIKRQLSNTQPSVKRRGIIGAICLAQQLDGLGTGVHGELIFSQVSGIPEINSDSIQILQYAIKHARPNDDDSWTPVVHLLTELQHRVASFSSSMTEWIQQNIALAMFTRYFAVNTSTTTTTSALWMPASVDDASAELAISIYPNCPTQSAAVVVDRSPIVLLCPLFKLLCMCEERGVGSASGGIETLFHAPLIMYDREQAADEGGPAVQSQRFIAVFYSIQWMRMLINALGATCSSDQKSICAERLGHLVELERLLEELWPLVDIQFFERSGFVPSLPLKKKQLRDKLWTLLKDRLIAVNHRGLLCLSGCIVESGLESQRWFISNLLQFISDNFSTSPRGKSRHTAAMRNGSSHHQELDVVESLLGDLLGVAETASGQLLEKCLQCLLITLDWLAVNGGSDVSTAIESAIADRLPDDSPNDDDYQSDELFKACKWILALSKHQCVAGDCSRIAELLIASNSSNDCARVDCKRLLQTHCLEASRSDYAIQDEKLLAYYLQTAIRNSDSPLDTMQSLLQLDVHQRLIGSESDQRVALGVYFNVLQSELVKVATAKTLTIDSLLICCAIFKDTLSILKTVETEGLLLDALKYGKQFVDFFTTKALPRLNDPKVIGDSVKSVQTGTRILQSVCSQAKSYKSVKLAKLVPVARKSLEAFILAIREKLSKSNSLDAMWVGNLKHRDLSGNHISSQYHPAETTELSAKRAKTTS